MTAHLSAGIPGRVTPVPIWPSNDP
jgi:hypothetical protein